MRVTRVATFVFAAVLTAAALQSPAAAEDPPVLTDTTAPVVKLVTPANNATYNQNAVVKASYSCTDSGGSGLSACVGTFANGANLPTQTTGTKDFTVFASDGAGNTTKVTRTYTVVAAPSIKVTAPNGGQVWSRGVSQTITWSAVNLPGTARLRVQVLKGASVVATPASSASPGAGSVSWTPSLALAKGADYRVKITVLFVSPSLTDTSDGPFALN